MEWYDMKMHTWQWNILTFVSSLSQ
jgi:hypothetical protein